MNITTVQLQAIRGILSKEDRQNIGMHTNKSHRTVDAVLQAYWCFDLKSIHAVTRSLIKKYYFITQLPFS